MRFAATGPTFQRYRNRTRYLADDVRADIFQCADEALQATCWAELRADCDEAIERARQGEAGVVIGLPRVRAHDRARRDRQGAVLAFRSRSDDERRLFEIEPAVYFEALTGIEVPAHGSVRAPWRDERTASVKLYPSADLGWYDFGGGVGGTIIDLAALVWGISPRGSGYREIVERLEAELLGRAVAA